jgi:hypothetical protein
VAGAGPPTAERRPGRGSGSSASGLTRHSQRTPIEDVERACDTAFLHLVSAGVVGTHPADLVTATLRQIMAEAHALHDDESPARRWWAS